MKIIKAWSNALSQPTEILQELVWDTTRTLAAELDAGLSFVRLSRGLQEQLGGEGADLLGRSLFEFMPDLQKEEIDMVMKYRNFARSIHQITTISGVKKMMVVLENSDDGAMFFAETTTIGQNTQKNGALDGGLNKTDILRELEELRMRNNYLEALNHRIRREHVMSSSTGLFKRRMLDQLVEAEIARSTRNHRPFALLLCGVDRAQALDQVAGEEARNKVMAVVAKAITARRRIFDVMGHFSPSELYIIQPENEIQGATEFAERIRTSIRGQKLRLGKVEFTLTLSFGVAFFQPEVNQYRDRMEMVAQAEAALFTSASSGGDKTTKAASAGVIAREVPRMSTDTKVRK